MYTLISHGSRIQVVQFHYWPDSPSSERSDNPPEEKKTGDKEKIEPKPFDFKTAKQTLENNKQSEKNDITNAGNPNIELLANLERGFAMAEKLPAIVSISLPLMGASADTAVSNTPEALPEKTHIIKSGDTLSKIAQVNGTTVAELQRINSLTDSNKIRVGETLHIPSSNIAATAVASAQANMAPAMPKPRINTAPNTQKNTVAIKPAEAPKVAVKTLQQELEEANKELGSAVYGKTLPAANKDYYTNLENTARANIATLEQKIKNQEKATQYAGFSENKKIWADFSDKYNKLQKESVTAGSAFTKSTEFKQAEKDIIMSNTIVKRDTEIAGLNTKYNTLMATNTPAAANERVAMRGTIDSLIKLNETQMAALKGSPSYASIQASKKLA